MQTGQGGNDELQRTPPERDREQQYLAHFLMDDRQHCVFMNGAAEELTGYRLEEALGRPLHDVVHHQRPDGTPYPLAECPIDQAFPERERMQGEEVFVHKDGRYTLWNLPHPRSRATMGNRLAPLSKCAI